MPHNDNAHKLRYGLAARDYYDGGWRPIPCTGKGRVPVDKAENLHYTGYSAAPLVTDAYDRITQWSGLGSGWSRENLVVHLGPDQIGIDLDLYSDPATGVIAAWGGHLAEHGALPPTVVVSSRFGDGWDGSGIRLYRLPAEYSKLARQPVWKSHLMPGVDICRFGHRQVAAWPSVHPERGTEYGWIDQREPGQPVHHAALPPAEDIPELSATHCAALTKDVADYGKAATRHRSAAVGDDGKVDETVDADGDTFVAEHDVDVDNEAPWVRRIWSESPWAEDGKPRYCRAVATTLADILAELTTGNRYDHMIAGQMRLARLGEQGHQGTAAAADKLRETYVPMVADKRPEPVARAEFRRGLADLPGKLAAGGLTAGEDVGCCGSTDPADLAEINLHTESGIRKAERIRHDERRLIAERESAVGQMWDEPETLAAILANPDGPELHRVRGLTHVGGRTTVVAARKTGKTTMVGNYLLSVLSGDPFLGEYEVVAKLTGSVAVLSYEMKRSQLGSWLEDMGLSAYADRLHVLNLRGRANPLATADGRDAVRAWLEENAAEQVVIDTFGRAFVGRSQDGAGDVNVWWSRVDGIVGPDRDLMLTVHAGWEGSRSRGSSSLEDNPDSIITLERKKGRPTRYLSALGRDVEVGRTPLAYDPRSRTLTVDLFGEAFETDRSEADATKTAATTRAREAIAAVLCAAADKLGVRELATRAQVHHVTVASVMKALIADGTVYVEAGPRGAKAHALTQAGRATCCGKNTTEPVIGVVEEQTDLDYEE